MPHAANVMSDPPSTVEPMSDTTPFHPEDFEDDDPHPEREPLAPYRVKVHPDDAPHTHAAVASFLAHHSGKAPDAGLPGVEVGRWYDATAAGDVTYFLEPDAARRSFLSTSERQLITLLAAAGDIEATGGIRPMAAVEVVALLHELRLQIGP